MTFIDDTKTMVEQIVYDFCVSPIALQKELKKVGFTYVKTRRNALVKYICRHEKSSRKIVVRL